MRRRFAGSGFATTVLACAALVAACGGKKQATMPGPPPEGAGVYDIMRHYLPHQQAQVERYCGCKDDGCRDSATTRLRSLIKATLDAIEKTDFDQQAPIPDDVKTTMKRLADRVTECEIPRDKLAVEPKDKLAKVVSERENEYAARAGSGGDVGSQEPAHDEPGIRFKDASGCKGALPVGDARCRAFAGEQADGGFAMPEASSATHCFASSDDACSCACGKPSKFDDSCSVLTSVSTTDADPAESKSIVLCQK